MKQINLFCLHCSKPLPVKNDGDELRDYLGGVVICNNCNRVVITKDIHEPRYLRAVWDRFDFEKKIKSLCALTGMSVSEMENYVEANNLSLEGMDELIESIAKGRDGETKND
jgi:hypothetical protein